MCVSVGESVRRFVCEDDKVAEVNAKLHTRRDLLMTECLRAAKTEAY